MDQQTPQPQSVFTKFRKGCWKKWECVTFRGKTQGRPDRPRGHTLWNQLLIVWLLKKQILMEPKKDKTSIRFKDKCPCLWPNFADISRVVQFDASPSSSSTTPPPPPPPPLPPPPPCPPPPPPAWPPLAPLPSPARPPIKKRRRTARRENMTSVN